ncbi:MAG: hypothetical protein JWN70_3943 [Planctomycetaceae bacterium]|nr:hypothetical protein [Planctomycetaceae bacterium]
MEAPTPRNAPARKGHAQQKPRPVRSDEPHPYPDPNMASRTHGLIIDAVSELLRTAGTMTMLGT